MTKKGNLRGVNWSRPQAHVMHPQLFLSLATLGITDQCFPIYQPLRIDSDLQGVYVSEKKNFGVHDT